MEAGNAFVEDHDARDDGDNEVPYNEAIETSSAVDGSEVLEEFDVGDDEEEEYTGENYKKMIIDAMGGVNMGKDDAVH